MVTKKQREILDFIEAFIEQYQHSPSYREIQAHFGFSSLGSVYSHIQTLRRKGTLKETRGARSLVLENKKPSLVEIPLIGKLQGGMPIELFPKIEMIPFPSEMVSDEKNLYLLQVDGYGLIEEQMQDQDLLLIHPRTEFDDGEMVLALVEKHTTFVKRVFADGPYIRLESTNPYVQPLILREEHLSIQGVILSLFRDYR